MRAQTTLEGILSFLAFLLFLSAALMASLQTTSISSSLMSANIQSYGASIAALNMGFVYALSDRLNAQNTTLNSIASLDSHIIFLGEGGHAYTLNPAHGAYYVQYKDSIPQ